MFFCQLPPIELQVNVGYVYIQQVYFHIYCLLRVPLSPMHSVELLQITNQMSLSIKLADTILSSTFVQNSSVEQWKLEPKGPYRDAFWGRLGASCSAQRNLKFQKFYQPSQVRQKEKKSNLSKVKITCQIWL